MLMSVGVAPLPACADTVEIISDDEEVFLTMTLSSMTTKLGQWRADNRGMGVAGPAVSLIPLIVTHNSCGLRLAVGCLTAFMGLQAFAYSGFHAYVQACPNSTTLQPLLLIVHDSILYRSPALLLVAIRLTDLGDGVIIPYAGDMCRTGFACSQSGGSLGICVAQCGREDSARQGWG